MIFSRWENERWVSLLLIAPHKTERTEQELRRPKLGLSGLSVAATAEGGQLSPTLYCEMIEAKSSPVSKRITTNIKDWHPRVTSFYENLEHSAP